MGTKKTEVMTSVRHGLEYSEEAKKELVEAKDESSLVKLNVLLDVCFKCKLCEVQSLCGKIRTKTWQKFSDMKHHLAIKHGISKHNPRETESSLGVFTRNKYRKKLSVLRNSSVVGFDNKDGNLHGTFDAAKIGDKTIIDNNQNTQQNNDGVDIFLDNDLQRNLKSSCLMYKTESKVHESEKFPQRVSDDDGVRQQLESEFSSEGSDAGEREQEARDNTQPSENCDNTDCVTSIQSDNDTDVQLRSTRTGKMAGDRQDKGRGISYLRRARTCPECEQVLDSIECCWQHYVENHNVSAKLRVVPSFVKNRKLSGTKTFNCPLCSKEVKGPSLLKHIILVHLWRPKLKSIRRKREMLCPKCGKAFNYEQNYYLHLRSVHGGIKPKSHAKYVAKEYKCNQCDYKTCETRRLNSHTKFAHSGIKAYSCKYCSYATWERTSLRDHMYRHKDSKPYHCDACSYQCIQKKQLRAHLMRVHSISLPKTGHTRVPARTGPRHLPSSIVQMADRETSTDPPPKRIKTKTAKLQAKLQSVQGEGVKIPKLASGTTSNQLNIGEMPQSTQASLCHTTSAPVNNQVLHYSVQGPVISQVSPPKYSSAQLPLEANSMICTFTVPTHNLEQQIVLPSGEQMHNLILPPGGHPLTMQNDVILPSGLEPSPNPVVGSPQAVYMAPNLQEKTAYQIIQIQASPSHQIPSTPSGDVVLNNSGKLADTMAVTPVYTQSQQVRNNLSISSLGQLNPNGAGSKASFVYVLK